MRAVYLFYLLLFLALAGARRDCDSDDLSGCQSCEAPPVDARRDCPKTGFDCSEEFLLANYSFSSSPETHCLRLRCADPLARLYVAGKPRSMLRCREGRWLFGPDASCHAADTAVCAKACKCHTFTPKDLYQEYDKALIRPACDSFPCPVAYCPPGTALFGTPVNSSSGSCPTLIGVGRTLVCTGNRQWKESGGEERLFSNALCSKHQRCTDSCRVDSLLPLLAPPRGFLFLPDHDAKLEVETHNMCMTLKCSKGSLATNCGVVDRLTIKCTHEAKWEAVDGTEVKNASCVEDCVTCPSSFPGHYGDEYARWTTDTSTGCKETLPCTGAPWLPIQDKQLRYITSENGNIFKADSSLPTASCGVDHKWYLTNTFAVLGVGCKNNGILDRCQDDCKVDPKMTLAHAPYGHRIVSMKPTKDNRKYCLQYKCEGNYEIIVMKGNSAPFVSTAVPAGTVQCKQDGYWYLNGETTDPVVNMACGEDCFGCTTIFNAAAFGLQDAIFSEYNYCVVPEACPSGPLYSVWNGGNPVSIHKTPKCMDSGRLKELTERSIRSSAEAHEAVSTEPPTPAPCVSCVPGKDGPGEWRIDSSNASYSHYMCAYQCGTECDTRTSGSAYLSPVALEKKNGCTVAQCHDKYLSGYVLNGVSEQLGRNPNVFCIAGINKWMGLDEERNPGRIYDRVECSPDSNY